MAKLASRSNKLSGVLAFEEMPEYGVCRRAVTVTVAAGMDVGAVLQFDGTSKYKWVANADVATLNADVVVLIEAGLDVPSLAPGDYTLTVLRTGHAGVVDQGLLFKDAVTAGNKTTVYNALRAKNIHVRTGV
jgi:hypothetical protein